MSDYDLPELPSDEELGITDRDRKKYGEDAQDEPELSPDEMTTLLGDGPSEKGRRDRGGATGPGAEAAAEPPAPRSRWKGPLTLAVMIAVSVVASTRTGLPRPGPASAPDTAFSSARAMTALVEIATRPHPIGSPEHARVRGLLVDRLEGLGLETEIQTATAMGEVTGMARAATVRNVVGRLPGTAPTGAVLIAAHYDTRELAPGAADDGAGVVTVLEAVRALRAAGPIENDLIVLITDGEEPCLCGAQAFVDQHPWIEDVSVVLNFEMRGGGGPSIMFETNDRNGWVVRALEATDPPPFANSMAYEVYRRMPNNTDFTEFRRAGKQGLNFAALDRAYVYHQASDRPENLSEATLQHHGTTALSLLRHLGSADLSEVGAPDAVYFTVPLLGLVVYDAFWVLPISLLLLALTVAAWLALRRGGARVGGVIAGLGVSVVGAALSFGAALWLRAWASGLHPEAGSLPGSFLYSEGWWVLSAVAAAFVIVATLHALARRWLTLGELSLGALILPLIAVVVMSVVLPLGAMNLQWPLGAALLALIVIGALGNRREGTVGWLVTAALTVPVLVLFVPVIELVWLAMSMRLITALAVLAALALYLCLPALDALRHPNAWWAPATGAVVTAACVGLGVLAARPSAERPAPSTLVYAYEHGTGSALWATDPNADPAVDVPAIEWAEQGAGGSFSGTRDLSDFGLLEEPMPVSDAPLVDAPPPAVVVLSDTITGAAREVSLAVRSVLGAEMLRFQVDPAGRTRVLSVNGAPIEEPDSLRWVEHYGVPEDPGVVVELRMPAAEPIGLYVIEHYFRPAELLGPGPFERPDDLMPDVTAMSDRAVFRYSVGAYADPRHAFMPGRSPGAGPEPSSRIPGDSAALGPPAVDSVGTPPADSTGSPEPVADSAGAAPPPGPAPQPSDSAVAPADSSDAPADTAR